MRRRTVTDYELTVVIERDEGGRYIAACPALQGCYTEGESAAEARELIKDAIRLHIEDRLATGEPIHEEVGVPIATAPAAPEPRFRSR